MDRGHRAREGMEHPISPKTFISNRRGCHHLRIVLRGAPPKRRWIELSGELIAGTTDELAECLDEALEQDERIVVDLRGVTAIDAAAVGLLLSAHMRAADDRRQLTIIPAAPWVQEKIDRVNGPFSFADLS